MASCWMCYSGSRKVPVPPPSRASVDRRGEQGSPGVRPRQQTAGCWRVHLYHSSQNLALQKPSKPQGSHARAWVHLCLCGWGNAHASTALENNFVGHMQQDSSHIQKFIRRFLSPFWLFYPACRFISKKFTHAFKKRSTKCCHLN